MIREKILLKLTGNVMLPDSSGTPFIQSLVQQIKALSSQYQFGIVIGGGNFFRGSIQGKALGMQQWPAHVSGMLATCMNGIILQDLFMQANIPSALFSAFDCQEIGKAITPETVSCALAEKRTLIFSGGTGNPFFTTDTNAVLRALQMGASAVWKGTDVSGIYDSNPSTNPNANLIKKMSHQSFIEQRLKIMDTTAITLAQEHKMPIRVFNILKPEALISSAEDKQIGSYINAQE